MCENTDYYKKPVFLTPVKQGPFYALKGGPALLAVCGGLKCNNDFQCLDETGEVIEGLYVLGNIMGDITAVDYPINVAGNSHGRCITFGYLLGHELAEAKRPRAKPLTPLRPPLPAAAAFQLERLSFGSLSSCPLIGEAFSYSFPSAIFSTILISSCFV